MSVPQIPVSMGAPAWTTLTAIGVCVPRGGEGRTVSWTRTSVPGAPVSMPTPVRTYRAVTGATVRRAGLGRTVTSVSGHSLYSTVTHRNMYKDNSRLL